MKFIKKTSTKTGLPPGALVHIGEEISEKSGLEQIMYNKENYDRKYLPALSEIDLKEVEQKVLWINVEGLHDIETIKETGEKFQLSPLLLEDVLNTDHRPKLEEFDHVLLSVIKMLSLKEDGSLQSEQLSLVLGKNFLLSFQEREGDVLDPVRGRLEKASGKFRERKADYLFYALLDVVVDHYFSIMEHMNDQLENLEEEIFNNATDKTLQKIQSHKKELIWLRKNILPLRELVSRLEKDEWQNMEDYLNTYFRDLYDHIMHIMDTLDSFRDMIANLKESYLSSLSHKMNKVMQVLTIIATIFIPLTFIAGIYGMNFNYMPELSWKYGYFGVWGIMVVVALVMLVYFRRKKWL